MNRHQQLSRVIVNGVSDTLDLCFKCVVQVAERFHRVLKTAVRHFERREALHKETRAAAENLFPDFCRSRFMHHSLNRLVMYRSKIEQALAFRDRAAAEFVGFS